MVADCRPLDFEVPFDGGNTEHNGSYRIALGSLRNTLNADCNLLGFYILRLFGA